MNSSPAPIGFVGLGTMGEPMARRLKDAGFVLNVFDTRPEVSKRLAAETGAIALESPAAVGGASDIVITMLPSTKAVRSVLIGGTQLEGLCSTMHSGSLVIDMSSSSPAETREMAQLLEDRGIGMLDAPVSGGVTGARAGKLTIMAGGAGNQIDRAEPIFRVLGEKIFRTGSHGSGQAMKAINNLVSAAGFIAAVEGLLIGRRFGLDPALMVDVLNVSTGRNYSTERKFAQQVLSRKFAHGFALELMVKDVRAAVELGAQTDTFSPFSRLCLDLWEQAKADLPPDADHTAVAVWFEKMADATLKASDAD